MKKWLVEYLSISKKERTGFVILVILISMIWILPRFFGKTNLRSEILAKADSVISMSVNNSAPVSKSFRLFDFDPNTLDDRGWAELGLTEKNIFTIRNYLSKGGRFREPGDIYRIYGLRSDVAERLEPYIKIKGTTRNSSTFSRQNRRPFQPFVYARRETAKPYKIPEIINLNEADTSALIALPGIGSKLAQRIILFRERCGGFYDVQQLSEVYGLKDSVFQLIRPRLTTGNGIVRQLSINSISADSLAKHPYISFSEARAIVQYRMQHGIFGSVDDLLNIAIISKQWVEKLKPYLDFN